MAKKSKSNEEIFNPYEDYISVLDDVAFKMSDADTIDDVVPMSTGSAVVDMIMGGGIRPAWYTNFGPEQSAKTTLALLMMASGIKEDVPIISFRDFEGSTQNSIPYVSSIMKTMGVKLTKDELFGKKNPTDGKWLIAPRVRYSASTQGVSFFNWFAAVLRRLPDKKMLNGQWYLVYEDTKENSRLKEHADSTMPKKYGKGIYIKAKDGGLQGLVLVDSYPNMNPTSKDEDEVDNSLAAHARMFAKNLPRVKGYLASKKVAVIGINQLRDVPMAMFGPSEQEPCGKALRFNSDVRLRLYPRNLKAAPLWAKPGAKDQAHEFEPSVTTDGKDKYKYVNVRAAKNKLSESGREGWLRIWVKDGDGVAHGIDPFYDTTLYLRQTGQLTGTGRQKLKLQLPEWSKPKDTPWELLKEWILGDKEQKIKVCKKLKIDPLNLRSYVFKQIKSGVGEVLYIKQARADEKKGKSEE